MDYELLCEVGGIAEELRTHWDSPRRWGLLRKYYALIEPYLLDGRRFDPYIISVPMTPIEFDVWCEIRYHGIPFYPQYPVGGRFVDFGDPLTQIAIEVDGAAFHTVAGDAKKDAELHAEGWHVLRIKGKDAWKGQGNNNLAPILGFYNKRPIEEESEFVD